LHGSLFIHLALTPPWTNKIPCSVARCYIFIKLTVAIHLGRELLTELACMTYDSSSYTWLTAVTSKRINILSASVTNITAKELRPPNYDPIRANPTKYRLHQNTVHQKEE
jgi:hypothetical protein